MTKQSIPYPLISQRSNTPTTTVTIGDIQIGDGRFVIIAGPCAVESQEQLRNSAQLVVSHGAHILRGGAFKPRTSPYAFQGLGIEGLQLLYDVATQVKRPFVTEVMDVAQLAHAAPLADALQVGARNMQNYSLLKELGQAGKPVILKRGFGASLTEWLLAAEYLAKYGNQQIILCERGIRSFGHELPFTLDLAGALWAKKQTHLPVIVDPSHATGQPDIIMALGPAIVAAGLDGLMVEVHATPHTAQCDGEQALLPSQFESMMDTIKLFAQIAARSL